MAHSSIKLSSGNVQYSSVSYATETEAVLLRSRVDALEETIDELKEQNELLRRQVAALKDGVWLRQE